MRFLRTLLWALVAVFVLGTAYLWWSSQLNGATLSEADKNEALSELVGGPFEMSDQNGKMVTDQTLKGKPFAIFFGFTHCPDVCPTSLQRLKKWRGILNDKQAGLGDAFQIVFVTVDPTRDTPKILGDYVALFDTPIIALSGSEAQLAQMTQSYMVYVSKHPSADGKDYSVDHTATIYLMGKDGKLVSTIAYDETEGVSLEKLERLARQ